MSNITLNANACCPLSVRRRSAGLRGAGLGGEKRPAHKGNTANGARVSSIWPGRIDI